MNVRLYNISIKCVLAILLSALFASCKDEDEEYKESSSDKNGAIGFNAFQDGFQKPTTRAVIDNIRDLDNLYVLSMKNNGSGWGKVFQEDVLTLTNNGYTTNGEIWDYSPEANWENGYNYKFRAFYPMNFNEGAGESCANGFQHSAISTGSTVLTLNNYRSATDPRNNSDLLVSLPVERLYATDGNTDPVDLQMKHLLACVDFKFKAKEGQKVTITKLSVIGYARDGSCTYSDGNTAKPEWTIPNRVNSNGEMIIDIKYTGQGGNLYDQDLHQTVNYPPHTVLSGGNEVVFKDKRNDEIIPPELFFDQSGQTPSYFSYSGGNQNYQQFYVVLAQSDPMIESESSSSFIGYEGLLFIPQKLGTVAEEKIKVIVNIKRLDWGNSINQVSVNDIVIKRSVYAEIEYYFDDNSANPLRATVDLTANGKVEEWEAGKRYIYTIGMYEYQVNANIDIEDWTHHTFEEELK